MQISSNWPIERALSGSTIRSQSGPGNDGNEGVLCIPQNSNITGTSPSYFLAEYPFITIALRSTLARIGSTW